MTVRWSPAENVAIQQLVELGCGSNAKLYSAGVRLKLIDAATIKKDSFHFHVNRQGWRRNATTHYKRAKADNGPALDLSGCRLGSSARVQFSVRLVPIAFYMREEREVGSGPIPDAKQIPVFGVLGVVLELCSGLLRAELLLGGCTKREDIYTLPEATLIDFVARSISLPGLKCAAVHFPRIEFVSDFITPRAGLVGAWLGAQQRSGTELNLDRAFQVFAGKVIKKAKWGGSAHKIRPDPSVFRMDFPVQQESTLIDLQKSCRKGWATHTLTRQLRERLDHYNTAVAADDGDLSPALLVWIARLCYFSVLRDDGAKGKAALVIKQRTALEFMLRSVCYRARIPAKEMAGLLETGMQHLSLNDYPTTK